MAPPKRKGNSGGEEGAVEKITVSQIPLERLLGKDYYCFIYTKKGEDWVGEPILMNCREALQGLVKRYKSEVGKDAIGPFELNEKVKLGVNRLPLVPEFGERGRYEG